MKIVMKALMRSVLIDSGVMVADASGRTPMDTLLEGKSIWVEKNLAQI